MIMPANPSANDRGSIPFRVVIDFMEGTKRKGDAEAFARGFIEHHFDSPGDSWYYVQPYPGGYAFEVHEGGRGKAYLPNIIETLEVNPTAVLSVPMARRNMQIKKSLNGTYTAILLPEGLETEEAHAMEATASRSMSRLKTTGLGIFTFGSVVFAAGFIAFFSALLMVFLDPAGIFFGGSRNTEFQQLPIQQWKTLTSSSNDQSYVKNLSFTNGKWGVDTGKRTLVDESGAPVDSSKAKPPVTPPSNETQASSPAPRTINPRAPAARLPRGGEASSVPTTDNPAEQAVAPENLPHQQTPAGFPEPGISGSPDEAPMENAPEGEIPPAPPGAAMQLQLP